MAQLEFLDFLAFIALGLYLFMNAGQIMDFLKARQYRRTNIAISRMVFVGWSFLARYMFQTDGIWSLSQNNWLGRIISSDFVFWPICIWAVTSLAWGYGKVGAQERAENHQHLIWGYMAQLLFFTRQLIGRVYVLIYGIDHLPRTDPLLIFVGSDEVFAAVAGMLVTVHLIYWIPIWWGRYTRNTVGPAMRERGLVPPTAANPTGLPQIQEPGKGDTGLENRDEDERQ